MRPIIVFDFDGTLVDAYEIKRESYWRSVSEVLGLGAEDRALVDTSYARTSGAHRFVQLGDTASALGRTVSDAEREEFSRRYSGYNEAEKDRMKPFPSARRVLEALRSGHDLVLTSGLPHSNLVAEAARHDLAGFFVEIEGGDKGATLDRLRAQGRTVVLFVGDAPHDEEVAASRGVRFYRVGGDSDLSKLPEVLR